MNVRRLLILLLGAIFLVLNFLFPYASVPTKERSDDGRTMRSTVHWGFTPMWRVWEINENAKLKGNPFDDAVIQWPIVIGFAAAIVVLTGWGLYRIGRSPPSFSLESEPPQPIN